jgi:hypothetical protein
VPRNQSFICPFDPEQTTPNNTLPPHRERLIFSTVASTRLRRNYREWILRKNVGQPMTLSQVVWLELSRGHIETFFHLERDDLHYPPFNAQCGLGKMLKPFGDQIAPPSMNSTGSCWREWTQALQGPEGSTEVSPQPGTLERG